MDIGEIIKTGFTYPTKNWMNLVILGIIFVIISLIGRVGSYTNQTAIIVIALIVSIILAIILQGYKIEIIGEGVKGSSDIPLLNTDNFLTGIKSILVSIVYYIIPAIIVTIVGLAVSYSVGVNELMRYATSLQYASMNPAMANATFNSLPVSFVSNLFTATITLGVIAFILFFIFSIFELTAQGKLAETGSLKEAVGMKTVIAKVGSIGWLKIIAFLIISVIIVTIVLFIGGLLLIIPIIGPIIFALVIVPFVFLYQFYSVGLLYASDE